MGLNNGNNHLPLNVDKIAAVTFYFFIFFLENTPLIMCQNLNENVKSIHSFSRDGLFDYK